MTARTGTASQIAPNRVWPTISDVLAVEVAVEDRVVWVVALAVVCSLDVVVACTEIAVVSSDNVTDR